MSRLIIPYNPKLKKLARQLINNSTKTEILLWQKLKRKQMYGYDFHRQNPIDNYILDLICHELMLGIEINGYSHNFLEVFEKDVQKTKKMNDLNISILQFGDYQISKEMGNVLRDIEHFIFEFKKV